MFAVNVRAPFVLTQALVRRLKTDQRPGSIVNIITRSSHGGQPFLTAYSSSKGALATLTKNNAHALRFARIRVNGLNIGWADTPGEHAIRDAMDGHRIGCPRLSRCSLSAGLSNPRMFHFSPSICSVTRQR